MWWSRYLAVILSLKPTLSPLASVPPEPWDFTVVLSWEELKNYAFFQLEELPTTCSSAPTHPLANPSVVLAFLILGLE